MVLTPTDLAAWLVGPLDIASSTSTSAIVGGPQEADDPRQSATVGRPASWTSCERNNRR
jgi:hypothetical protein